MINLFKSIQIGDSSQNHPKSNLTLHFGDSTFQCLAKLRSMEMQPHVKSSKRRIKTTCNSSGSPRRTKSMMMWCNHDEYVKSIAICISPGHWIQLDHSASSMGWQATRVSGEGFNMAHGKPRNQGDHPSSALAVWIHKVSYLKSGPGVWGKQCAICENQ